MVEVGGAQGSGLREVGGGGVEVEVGLEVVVLEVAGDLLLRDGLEDEDALLHPFLQQEVVGQHNVVVGRRGALETQILHEVKVLVTQLHVQDGLLGRSEGMGPAVDHWEVLFQTEVVDQEGRVLVEGYSLEEYVLPDLFSHHLEEEGLVSMEDAVF